jgi:secreted trypsin-like serine protease
MANPMAMPTPDVGMIAFFDEAGEPLWRCSGSLISPTVVLTAAHCTSLPAARAKVFFQPDLDVLGINHRAKEGTEDDIGGHWGTPISHPDWVDPFSNRPTDVKTTPDIGVIILDEPVVMDRYAVITSLGKLDQLAAAKPAKRITLDVVGYGLQYIRRSPAGIIKLQAERVRYQGEVTLTNMTSALTGDSYIQHTGDEGKGNGSGATSFGDSGGPVFLQGTDEIVALTSWGLNFQATGPGFAYRVDIPTAQEFILFALDPE